MFTIQDSDFLIVTIVALSVITQAVAAILAIRLIGITGRRVAWTLITTALVLMTLRRIMPLYRLISENHTFPPEPFNEVVGLILSIAMAIGISRIAPIFIERKKAEEAVNSLNRRLQNLLDAASEVSIIATDKQGIITLFNHGAERMLGYAAAEMVGKETPMLIHVGDEVEKRARELTEELSFPVSGFLTFVVKPEIAGQEQHEWTYVRKDRTQIQVSLVVTTVRSETNEITGYLGIAQDITERKRSEEQLRQYKDHLEEEVQQRTADLELARNAAEAANLAKSVFLANMSHELRTPLNAILGFSGMMRRDPLITESQRENLDIVNRSGEHLLTLINDILEMAKIEAGRIQLKNVAFDLGSMIRDVTDMMQMRAEDKGLRLLLDQSSHFPRYIVGDEARLRQVLINLMSNAVKFTRQGDVTLRLGTRKNTITHLLIEVEDSGLGIAPEDQQRIFDPFVQLGEQANSKGTGLGLAITRQFVQLMGGCIGLESTPGKGSLFRIELPLNEVLESDFVQSKQVIKGNVVGLAPNQPEYRILIVEDQHENQLLLTKLMQSVGFQAKVAENGKQGVELFQSWHPHLIWMDRRMPIIDGLEATQIIRALPGGKDVKIIAVTASAFIEQRIEGFEAGVDDYVRKPYRLSEIYECLTKHLGVSYVYQEEPEQPTLELTAEMLSVLPESLRSDLKQALENLESERIELVIQQVSSYDLQLQRTLNHLAENFEYPTILKAL